MTQPIAKAAELGAIVLAGINAHRSLADDTASRFNLSLGPESEKEQQRLIQGASDRIDARVALRELVELAKRAPEAADASAAAEAECWRVLEEHRLQNTTSVELILGYHDLPHIAIHDRLGEELFEGEGPSRLKALQAAADWIRDPKHGDLLSVGERVGSKP